MQEIGSLSKTLLQYRPLAIRCCNRMSMTNDFIKDSTGTRLLKFTLKKNSLCHFNFKQSKLYIHLIRAWNSILVTGFRSLKQRTRVWGGCLTFKPYNPPWPRQYVAFTAMGGKMVTYRNCWYWFVTARGCWKGTFWFCSPFFYINSMILI